MFHVADAAPPSCTEILVCARIRSTACWFTGLPGKRAVEIDDMQIVKALRGELFRLRGGIAMEHRRARHVALLQAHALAFFQVNGGKENHGFHFRKLAISARPRRWLFSGWNCVPTTVSRATIAVTAPP